MKIKKKFNEIENKIFELENIIKENNFFIKKKKKNAKYKIDLMILMRIKIINK